MSQCVFDEAWIGRCKQSAVEGHAVCAKHLSWRCYKCGKQATSYCGYAGQFVCGTPICPEHNHYETHYPPKT